ncbi:uncharacterized protein BDZ83DRAFT_627758 [Colletotrichum acutatum]|uniref:Uncharacterized protein n=1 Tax=Glomerella acutata TaxID=27357 RepID=A0AAD8UK22_GLOAC|nr:uncharacterized protein BDZ83DRAFT_627758 [Colletotrichum acutatum]KAK1722963.1 hypothetical protein BDZ83DRAFT_627758 [Colletotrichum acutatum]
MKDGWQSQSSQKPNPASEDGVIVIGADTQSGAQIIGPSLSEIHLTAQLLDGKGTR